VPVAAFARLDGDRLALSGLVGSVRDGRLLRAQATSASHAGEALGIEVADALLAQGAGDFIAASAGPDSGPYIS
jgi:hydroxymethylbilane synthase